MALNRKYALFYCPTKLLGSCVASQQLDENNEKVSLNCEEMYKNGELSGEKVERIKSFQEKMFIRN